MSKTTLTTEAIVAEFVTRYNAAKGADKVKARTMTVDAAQVAMKDGNPDLALALLAAHGDMKATVDSTPSRTKGQNLEDRYATLRAALDIIDGEIGGLATEDMAPKGYVGQVNDKLVSRYTTIASTTKADTFRGAVAQYVGQVANHLGSGSYTVADIAKAPVEYPTPNAKPGGAIGAYLDRNDGATIDTEDGASYTVTTDSKGHRVIVVA